ncbi:MAG: tyrosine-type recombinase/integrase [Rhizobiales bacterium]|nr:tyrosine-type recombinase/integrase [Hyphomicrobiales bacterium]
MISKPRGQMQPFTIRDVETIRTKLTATGSMRDLALFEVAISTALRASDVTGLRVRDVTDGAARLNDGARVRQRKTGNVVTVPLSPRARDALAVLIADQKLAGDAFLFQRQDQGGKGQRITTETFAKLVKRWADLAGYTDTSKFSGHSTRRTRAAYLYDQSKDIANVAKLLGHSSVANAMHYLNIGNDDALALARRYEM